MQSIYITVMASVNGSPRNTWYREVKEKRKQRLENENGNIRKAISKRHLKEAVVGLCAAME